MSLDPDLFADDAPAVEPLPLVGWPELFDRTEVEEAHVDGLVIPGRWIALVAPAKAGKSTLTLHIATALATGRDPFTDEPRPPLSVLYIDTEMARLDVYERLAAAGYGPDDLARLHYCDIPPKCDDVPGAVAVTSSVHLHAVDVVVLDGINGLVSGAEKDDVPWRRFFELTIAPLKRAGVAVLTTDNMGKDRTLSGRGSSVKIDKPDAVIELSRTDRGVRLYCTHRRAWTVLTELQLSIIGQDGSEPIRYRITEDAWPAGTAAAAALLDRLGVPKEYGRAKVRAILREHGEGLRDVVLAAAIRYRKASGTGPGTGTPEQVVGTA